LLIALQLTETTVHCFFALSGVFPGRAISFPRH
jgi:hypothetical protein